MGTYIWYIVLEGDKMPWRHLYLIHLTWGGIKWHERGLDDSVWPPLREFWGSVARRKGHHSLPAKSIISSHFLLIFLHFIFFFNFSVSRGSWGSMARRKGIIMNSRRGNYDSYQTKMFEANWYLLIPILIDTCPQFHVILRSFISIGCNAWKKGKKFWSAT